MKNHSLVMGGGCCYHCTSQPLQGQPASRHASAGMEVFVMPRWPRASQQPVQSPSYGDGSTRIALPSQCQADGSKVRHLASRHFYHKFSTCGNRWIVSRGESELATTATGARSVSRRGSRFPEVSCELNCCGNCLDHNPTLFRCTQSWFLMIYLIHPLKCSR